MPIIYVRDNENDRWKRKAKKTKTERRITYYLKSVYSQLTEWTLKKNNSMD